MIKVDKILRDPKARDYILEILKNNIPRYDLECSYNTPYLEESKSGTLIKVDELKLN